LAAAALALAACSPTAEPEALAAPPVTESFTPAQAEDIGTIVRAYLVNNPGVLEEAFQALQDKRMADAMTAMTTDPRAFSLGPRDAPITNVRVVVLELPSLGPQTMEASQAAIASMRQGKYIELHRALMGHQGPLDGPTIDQLARDVGLDIARMRRDMADPDVEDFIADSHDLAASIGGRGTPLFVINGRMVPGFDEASLNDALRQAAAEERT
jgi:hypothetical protein